MSVPVGIGHEAAALATRAPVDACPVCRDEGRRLCRFSELVFPDGAQAYSDSAQPRMAVVGTRGVTVRCRYGHQFECPSWARTPYSEEYVLARRLQDAPPAG